MFIIYRKEDLICGSVVCFGIPEIFFQILKYVESSEKDEMLSGLNEAIKTYSLFISLYISHSYLPIFWA